MAGTWGRGRLAPRLVADYAVMTGPWPPCSPPPPPACGRPTSTVLSLLQGETMVMEDDQRRCDSGDTGCELRDCIGLIPIKKKRTTRGVSWGLVCPSYNIFFLHHRSCFNCGKHLILTARRPSNCTWSFCYFYFLKHENDVFLSSNKITASDRSLSRETSIFWNRRVNLCASFMRIWWRFPSVRIWNHIIPNSQLDQ